MQTRDEVSAGGVCARAREGGGHDVALIRTHEGRWQLPKGWIEAGEPPEAAAIREVREEAGIDAEVIEQIGTVRYRYVSKYDAEPALIRKQVHVFLMRYVAGSTDDHDDEVQEARWVDIDEALRTLTFKDEQRMVQMARDALAAKAAR